ncbi:hypothetical protein BKI51_02540 [Alphaproteobacteria bacterium AO1-B]|nr:hypothetical protein BKI51_02540 [Alphaproteobacteria bacterium AO1-B]
MKDNGAHFYRCDFQVHTPRDAQWAGPRAVTDDERLAYARRFVRACREKGIGAVAITDHHCMTFLPFIRRAASEEPGPDGQELPPERRLVVFPGVELTLGVPCQAIVIFDADFPNDMFSLALTALAITPTAPAESIAADPTRLSSVLTFDDLKRKLDEHEYLRDRYIILPNVSGEGKDSLLRTGQADKYIDMPCVGGYTDGTYQKLKPGVKNRLEGKDQAWGNRPLACIQTSDSRRDDHTTLGEPSTWIKWAVPTAEALRQACLAEESRISREKPLVPETYIAAVSVSNSSFLGPLDMKLNPQYSALIGGRGTGKSTVLEYLRWALCDQPPDGDNDETPNYQARRARLIKGTLAEHKATVDVHYVLNGVPHQVRRSSVDGSVQMKIGDGALQACTEEEVRALLPIQAYSQKQLSDVSVRLEELTRFITTPIRGDLDRAQRRVEEQAGKTIETYAARQRFRELSRTLHNRELEVKSISEQAETIRQSLSGLTEEDRALLDQGQAFNKADALMNSWSTGAETLRGQLEELRALAERQQASLQPVPEEPTEAKGTVGAARERYVALLNRVVGSLDDLVASSRGVGPSDEGSPWSDWSETYNAFQARYEAATQRSSSHTEKLNQLKELETRVAELGAETTRVRDALTTLDKAEEAYDAAWSAWVSAQLERDDLIDRECARLTERSGDLIRVRVERFTDASAFVEALRSALQGSRVQGAKIEAVGSGITAADDPRAVWSSALADLERLASYDSGNSLPEARPEARALQGFGLSASDVDKIADHLSPEKWLTLALTPIASVPVYEFRAREGEYIPFANASAGQQATALLKTLLNQPGPPLIIDQPEEDLDNPVMLEVVEQLWRAKRLRQIVFASHNANLVVNGDAELVTWFDYRTTGDQSRGTIKGVGAIDIAEAREAIKRIMEGGEAAFRLRREKYGF